MTLHHASQVPHTSRNYSVHHAARTENVGSGVATPSGCMSIETILSSNGALGGDGAQQQQTPMQRTPRGWDRMKKRLSVVGKSSSSSSIATADGTSRKQSMSSNSSVGVPAQRSATVAVPERTQHHRDLPRPATDLKIASQAQAPARQTGTVSAPGRAKGLWRHKDNTHANGHAGEATHVAGSGPTGPSAGPSATTTAALAAGQGRKPRDRSLSPLTTNLASNPSSNPSLNPPSSPPSSLIFERSVQDVAPQNDQNVPTHYHDENFIPAVLDASTSAITDASVDPDMIDVLSLRHASRSRSLTASSALSAGATSPTSGSASPERVPAPRSPIGFGVGLGVKVGSQGSQGSQMGSPQIAPVNMASPAREGSFSQSGEPRHVLSFCSFADIVNTEQQEQHQQQQQQNQKHKDSVSAASSPLVARRPSMGFEMFGRPRAATRAESYDDYDEDDRGLSITSMGETLRRNTGEITSQIHA